MAYDLMIYLQRLEEVLGSFGANELDVELREMLKISLRDEGFDESDFDLIAFGYKLSNSDAVMLINAIKKEYISGMKVNGSVVSNN